MSRFNGTITTGERFVYKGIQFVCLDVIHGNYLAVTAKPYTEIPFDTSGKNDWHKSSLRRVLNQDFLDHLDRKHLVKQVCRTIADNGDRTYGTSEDYVTILSCEQYRKYRDVVSFFGECTWTRTPSNCVSSSSYLPRLVRFIYRAGDVDSGYAHYYGKVYPVCLFSSKALKLCRPLHLVGIDEDDE